MTGAERLKKHEEVQALLAELVERGWKIDKLGLIDEAGQPFKAEIDISCDGLDIKNRLI